VTTLSLCYKSVIGWGFLGSQQIWWGAGKKWLKVGPAYKTPPGGVGGVKEDAGDAEQRGPIIRRQPRGQERVQDGWEPHQM